jgi:hypothetical protein
MMEGGLEGGLEGGYSAELHKKKHCVGEKGTGSCLDEDLIRDVGRIMNQLRKKDHAFTEIDLSQSCAKVHEAICKNLKTQGCRSEACMLTMSDSILNKLGKKKKKRFITSFYELMPKDWLNTKGKTARNKRKKRKRKSKRLRKARARTQARKAPEIAEEEVDPEHLPREEVDENAWLATDDIEGFLDRQTQLDDEFVTYGAVPIDFSDCSVSNLCRFSCKDHLEKGQTKIAIVFNTDPHNKEGEHWISMYIDLKGHNFKGCPAIYYFDSYGRKPPKKIQALIEKAQNQGRECGNPLKYFYNDHGFQRHGAQCGMYAINFIKDMLSGKSFQEYLNSGTGDDKMKDLRDDYFIDPNEI